MAMARNLSSAGGESYRGILYKYLRVEIFSADKDNWGYILWLRTGPDSEKNRANTYLVTKLQASPFELRGGYLWDRLTLKKISVPDEFTFFVTLLGFPHVPAPDKRNINIYKWLFEDKRHHHWRGWAQSGTYQFAEDAPVKTIQMSLI